MVERTEFKKDFEMAKASAIEKIELLIRRELTESEKNIVSMGFIEGGLFANKRHGRFCGVDVEKRGGTGT